MFLGRFQRIRFHLIVSLLPEQPVQRLLEVGYGSGIFLPELRKYCVELHGVDPHSKNREIERVLKRHGVSARLHCGSAADMPFDDEFFNCIVIVSALEFVEDIAAACRELARVLSEGGSLIIVTPGHSRLVDMGLRVLTGASAQADYGGCRQAIRPSLARHFAADVEIGVPAIGGAAVRIYSAMRLRRKR